VSVEARWWLLAPTRPTLGRSGSSVLIALGAFAAAMWAPGNRTLDGLLATLGGVALFLLVDGRHRGLRGRRG